MKCNFYEHKYLFYLVCFLCLASWNSYGQTDSLSMLKNKSSKIVLEKSVEDYNKKQENAISKFLKQGFKKIIETKEGEYSELIGENALGKPQYFIAHNDKVVSGLKADVLQNGFDGLNLEGNGIRIALWENGQPRRAHEMFRTTVPPAALQSRIEYVTGQNATIQRHATHIAGTLIGNQYLPSTSSPSNNLVRGVAFKGTIKAWDWLNVPSEMIQASTIDNIKIANTSFGLNPIYMHAAEFGRYNDIAQQWDAVMCSSPEFQIVKSVGNARDDVNTNGFPQYPQVNVLQGLDLLEGAGVAKNVLVVGSVNLTDGTPENGNYNSSLIDEAYSSWGATDDGRIKPDFVTHGKNVLSSIETQNNTYGLYSGTSQAAAGVTGGIALLHNYWNSKFPSNMWSSTVRALLVHNIDEIDDKGPDYKYGWGVVNLEKAATTIKQRGKNVIIREDVLQEGDVIKINLAATGQEDLKVTLAWTDPAGNVVPIDINNPNAAINETAAKLINDLDIRLIRKDSNGNDDLTLIDPTLNSTSNNLLLPWILKEQIQGNAFSDLTQKAQRGDNDRDNIEKIEVYKDAIPSTGGMFQLQITHKENLVDACQTGQPFSLIVSGISFCQDNLVFLQNQDNELSDFVGTKVLANTIKASNIIKFIPSHQAINPDFVEYKAADFIELLPQSQNGGTIDEGFTAEFGSDFLAHIGCTDEDYNQRISYSEKDIQNIINDESIDSSISLEKSEMVIYPNPLINDILNIQFSIIESSTLEVQIYDLTGKLVFEDVNNKIYEAGVNKKSIDLQNLSSGTYILLAKSKDKNYQAKFIKQ